MCSSATVASDWFLAPLVAFREWPASAMFVLGTVSPLKARKTCILLLYQNWLNHDLMCPLFVGFLFTQSSNLRLEASNEPGVGA